MVLVHLLPEGGGRSRVSGTISVNHKEPHATDQLEKRDTKKQGYMLLEIPIFFILVLNEKLAESISICSYDVYPFPVL